MVARARAEFVKDRAKEWISKTLRDDRARSDRVGSDEGEPFKISKMKAGVNRWLGGIGAARIELKPTELTLLAYEVFREVWSPAEFQHGSSEGGIGTPSDTSLLASRIFCWKGAFEVCERDGAAPAIQKKRNFSKCPRDVA